MFYYGVLIVWKLNAVIRDELLDMIIFIIFVLSGVIQNFFLIDNTV